MNNVNELYEKLLSMVGEKKISEFIDFGSVACAIVTEKGNTYFGLNIQASCGLSLCAERIAISNAIMNDDTKFKYVLCIFKDGSILTPCGSCREMFAETGKQNFNMEIITSLNPVKTIKLSQMISDWWGDYRY